MKNFAVWWIRCQLGSTESNTSVYDPGIKKIIQRVKIFRKSIDTCCLLSVIGYQWPRIVTSNHKPEVWTPPSPKQHDIIQKKRSLIELQVSSTVNQWFVERNQTATTNIRGERSIFKTKTNQLTNERSVYSLFNHARPYLNYICFCKSHRRQSLHCFYSREANCFYKTDRHQSVFLFSTGRIRTNV